MTILGTLRKLLDEYGVEILENPLRVNAFLRDLHPNLPRETHVLVEVMESGVLSRMRRENPRLDSELQGLAAHLCSSSGLTPNYAHWGVQGWLDVLPSEAFEEDTPEEEVRVNELWPGTLEEVLGR